MSSKPEAHTFRDDIDLEQLHIIGFDHAGTYEHFKKQQTDIYEIALEILANALDAKNLGEPHRITVLRNKHPVPNPDQPILEVKDGGPDGIAMDYDHDVFKLIQAVKAHSRKPLGKHKIGSKGIGMLQFPNIAPTVVFTSMYQGLIARFGLVETKEENGNEEDRQRHRRVGAFSHPKVVAATQENKQIFDIYEDGTKVSFYDRNPNLSWIQPKTLMNKISDEYAIRLAENEKLEIFVNGKRVYAPEEYREHKPKPLFKTSKGYEVRGAIWANPKGTGNVVLFRGHRIMNQYIDPRQCEGYAECWELEPDTARTSFVDDETTKDVISGLRNLMKQFPSIKDDPQNKRQLENLGEMASMMLADVIPPMPVQYGAQADKTKELQQGDLKGTGILGHRPKKEPDPNREIIPRAGGPHRKRGEIGANGTDQVMTTAEQESKRREEYQLRRQEVNYGENMPLMKLFNEKGRVPALLTINKDNCEYPMYKELFIKDPKAYNLLVGVWMSELYYGRDENNNPMGLDDKTRLLEGRRRVAMWRMIGRYPVIPIATKSYREVVEGT